MYVLYVERGGVKCKCSMPMKRDRQMNVGLRSRTRKSNSTMRLMPKVRDCNALISDDAFCAVVRRRFVQVFADAAYNSFCLSQFHSSPFPPSMLRMQRGLFPQIYTRIIYYITSASIKN